MSIAPLVNTKLYQYLPILQPDGIRLIELEPSQDKDAPIKCNLTHPTLSNLYEEIVDHYTALSYVWGDATNTTEILVGTERLKVTASLECALKHLRDERRVLYVWADGACINQNDIEERNQQVRQMGSIYDCATHTVIFLGPSKTSAKGGIPPFPRPGHADVSDTLRDVLEILESPWFYRVWIYQELVMSHDPKVQYGQVRYPWEQFCDMLKPYLSMHTEHKLPVAQLQGLKQSLEVIFEMRKGRHSWQEALLNGLRMHRKDDEAIFQDFTSILAARRGFGVSDPRDMIFAHLGMVGHTGIRVDYGRKVEQIYEEFARAQMIATSSLDLLAYVEDVELGKRRPGMPSWVPDWTVQSSSLQPMIEHCYTRKVTPLRDKGLHDLLESLNIDENLWWGNVTTFWFEGSSHLCSFGLSLYQLYDISSVMDDMDDDPEFENLRTWNSHEDNFGELLDYCSKKIGTTVELEPTFDEPRLTGIYPEVYFRTGEATNYIDSVMENLALRFRLGKNQQPRSIIDGRKFAITSHGLALVPASTLPGDMIYIIRGMEMPLVLRKLQHTAPSNLEDCIRTTLNGRENVTIEHMQLIGGCFVDNLAAGIWENFTSRSKERFNMIVIH
ncbi:hypothetical protein EG329_001205 [Mollisiaceae sp. DMI_Dod_QoI]|nr:hypothetical protein EG329_001205 [Helotiales sp. DMI_Dod_QoI]